MRQLDIVGIVGSLRRDSVNRAVARAAIIVAPPPLRLELFEVADVPVYNGDVEDAGIPAPVELLQTAAGRADGIIFFTPEYNSSLPAVTKNVIDWLSRPPRLWEGTAVTAVAATPGRRAGAGVLGHFRDIVEHQPVRVFGETLGIGSYREKLDASGELSDPESTAELAAFLGRFGSFVATPE